MSIFNKNSLEETEEMLQLVCSKYTKPEPILVECMEENIGETFIYLRYFLTNHIFGKR